MANANPDWAVALVLHEYVHTQQQMSGNYSLLGQCLSEGMADFVAEVVNEKPMAEVYPGGYIDFGLRNEADVWKSFKTYLFASNKGATFDWLYGAKGRAINGQYMRDLGYFMGYVICKSYYEKASDKTQALREMIEAKLSDDENARRFLLASGYVPAADLAWAQQTPFAVFKEEKWTGKKEIFGYKITADTIVFEWKIPQEMNASVVKKVNVAGTFNQWNPQHPDYQMTERSPGLFELKIPQKLLAQQASHQFKFVLNGENWVSAPPYALNVDETGYENLTLSW
jgi:Predicted Zn-dependent protease (DUF2268)